MQSKYDFNKWIYFAGFALCLAFGCGDSRRGRAVILISLDTLRQDHLGCYGYGRETSPNIDRFAREEGIIFEAAFAQAPYTLPSHMSILTGLYPEAHGVLLPNFADPGKRDQLGESVVTLAEALKVGGYKTTAFTDGLLVDRKYGFDQGFDEYRDKRGISSAKNGFRKYREELHEWIQDNRENDFFLFIHTYDTHAPYEPPEPFLSRFGGAPPAKELASASLLYCELLYLHCSLRLKEYADLQEVIDRYDGGIAFVDEEVGRMFSLLKELGLWDNALIVLTSDHGEAFMENGVMMGHGLYNWNEEILIPLIMKLPGSPYSGHREQHVVESVDIMPTILSALDIPLPPDLQGQNLLHGLEDGRWAKGHAYGTSPQLNGNRYLIKNGIKFIEGVEDPNSVLLKCHAIPSTPPMSLRPKKPYYAWNKEVFYYDFGKDPLGVEELFYRGDQAYYLKTAKYEWQAEAVQDRDVLMKYKKAAYTIAVKSAELGQKFRDSRMDGETTSAEELEQLRALGYAGLVASGELVHGEVQRSRSSPLDLKITPPLTDRTLLNRGDKFLWTLYRTAVLESTILMDAEKFAQGMHKARRSYEEFKSHNPNKRHWVEWRLKYLNQAKKIMEQAKDEGK